MITRLIISGLAVLITAFTLDGVTVEPWWWAVIIAIVLGFINSCIKPLVKLLACSWIVRPHFEVANFGWAFAFSIVLTLVSWVLHLFSPSKN